MYLTDKENELQTYETICLQQFCNETETKFEPRTCWPQSLWFFTGDKEVCLLKKSHKEIRQPCTRFEHTIWPYGFLSWLLDFQVLCCYLTSCLMVHSHTNRKPIIWQACEADDSGPGKSWSFLGNLVQAQLSAIRIAHLCICLSLVNTLSLPSLNLELWNHPLPGLHNLPCY